jgi:hypothetical protein
MPPDTEPTPPETPEDIEYLSELWLDLDWSPWVPFDAPREFFYIPREPGVYRIRPAGKDFLMFIGETGQSLHKKLAELRQGLRRTDLMPWSDPQESGPCLWAWRAEWMAELEREEAARPVEVPVLKEENPEESSEPAEEPEPPAVFMYECSAAPLDASVAGRKGMESFLLYRYRQDHGESPVCNFGRFHPRYRKSTKKNVNRRGEKLGKEHIDNPAGFASFPPLAVMGKPGDPDWMGLEWTPAVPLNEENIRAVSPGAGLYLLTDAALHEVLYIGQAADVAERLQGHTGKEYGERELLFSYQILGQKVLPHNLLELANDLIGNFYEQDRKTPELQFRSSR